MADNLPIDIAVDIFSRLSAGTVLVCKRVCKTWHNYLSHPDHNKSFAKIHLSQLDHHWPDHKKDDAGFIFLLKSENIKPFGHPLYHGEFDGSNVQKTLRKINHPNIRTKRDYNTNLLVGSCNGLICVAESRRNNLRDPVHICNPITRECLYLPRFDENSEYECKSVLQIYSGFGYSTRTNEYKVVRILYSVGHDHSTIIGHIEVYTLGSGNGWRNKGVISNKFDSTYGVFGYGDLYWLDSIEKKKMAFNLTDEKFHVHPSGAFFRFDKFWFLRSWGEQLCGVGFKNESVIICSFFKSKSGYHRATFTGFRVKIGNTRQPEYEPCCHREWFDCNVAHKITL